VQGLRLMPEEIGIRSTSSLSAGSATISSSCDRIAGSRTPTPLLLAAYLVALAEGGREAFDKVYAAVCNT